MVWNVKFLIIIIQFLHILAKFSSAHPHRAPFEVIGAPRAEHFVGVQSRVRVWAH